MTVAQSAVFALDMAGKSASDIHATLQQALERLDLADKTGPFPRGISAAALMYPGQSANETDEGRLEEARPPGRKGRFSRSTASCCT
jgi:hypothetical protein